MALWTESNRLPEAETVLKQAACKSTGSFLTKPVRKCPAAERIPWKGHSWNKEAKTCSFEVIHFIVATIFRY